MNMDNSHPEEKGEKKLGSTTPWVGSCVERLSFVGGLNDSAGLSLWPFIYIRFSRLESCLNIETPAFIGLNLLHGTRLGLVGSC